MSILEWFGYYTPTQRDRDSMNEEVPAHDPGPGRIPTPEEIDDWVFRQEDWRGERICHCGHVGCLNQLPNIICPKCGHRDKWSTQVVRYECEYSSKERNLWERRWGGLNCFVRKGDAPSFECRYVGPDSLDAPWYRNQRRIIWTEDLCPVKDGE